MDKDSKPVSRRLTTSIVLVAVLGGLGTFVYRDLARVAAETRAADVEKPLLARDGNRVTVPPDSPLRNKLTIETVMEKDIQQKLVLPGVVEADPGHLVKVLPPLAGRIMEVKVQLGERVELGQALSVLDSPDLATAYADYDRAKVIFSLAATTRDRQRGLAKIGGGAIKDQQQAETDYVTAEVEQQRALARLKQIGVEAETTNKSRTVTITAPISGSVIDLSVAPGAYWNDTTAALMTIADLTTIWVTANVPEKDTALIAKGQAVDVVLPAYPDETFKGQVLFVSDVLDSDTRRTKVRIAFANPGIRLQAEHVRRRQLHYAVAGDDRRSGDRAGAEGRRRPDFRRGGAVGVRAAPHRDQLPEGRRRHRQERRQGRGSRGDEGRSPAQ